MTSTAQKRGVQLLQPWSVPPPPCQTMEDDPTSRDHTEKYALSRQAANPRFWSERSRDGMDVVVETEEIVRVVFRLDLLQTPEVPSVRALDARVCVLVRKAGEVEVGRARSQRRYLRPRVAYPADDLVVVGGVLPIAVDGDHPVRGALAVGGVLGSDTVDSPAHEERDEEDAGRGPFLRLSAHDVECVVGQVGEIGGLPVAAECAAYEELVEGGLHRGVRDRARDVGERRGELTKWLEDLHALVGVARVDRADDHERGVVDLGRGVLARRQRRAATEGR